MKAIVIGANGFLGKHLTFRLLKEKYKVIAVYNKDFNNISPLADIVSFERINTIDPTEIDVVFYLSGSFASTYNDLININCHQLSYVSNLFKSAKFVYISSSNVYGDSETTISESSCFSNPGNYGMSKIAGEFIIKNHRKYAILRLCYLYGPLLNNNSFLPKLIKQARQDLEITLYGAGEREQDYLYVDDAVSMCYSAACYDGNDIFLGATGKSHSNKFISELIRSEDENIRIRRVGSESGQSLYFNPEQTFKKLNWQPEVSIAEGIKNMWNASTNLW